VASQPAVDERAIVHYRFALGSRRNPIGLFEKGISVTEHWNWLLLIPWLAWWLWGVNWKNVWAVLAEGAWLPVLLIMIVAAMVWSEIAPSDCTCLGFVTVPNFWWQLGGVGLLTAITLLCGWLQGVFGWSPLEASLEPPEAPAFEHDHS
jgi:hypothetical protein